MLLAGSSAPLLWLRRRPVATPSVAPLTPQEQVRLEGLLREADR